MDTTLPEGFAALEPFAAKWAAPTTAERAALRGDSSPDEREAFFAAASPLLEAALDHLDARELRALLPADQRLMNLMLSLAHVSHAVETHGAKGEAQHARWRSRMTITRSTADA